MARPDLRLESPRTCPQSLDIMRLGGYRSGLLSGVSGLHSCACSCQLSFELPRVANSGPTPDVRTSLGAKNLLAHLISGDLIQVWLGLAGPAWYVSLYITVGVRSLESLAECHRTLERKQISVSRRNEGLNNASCKPISRRFSIATAMPKILVF